MQRERFKSESKRKLEENEALDKKKPKRGWDSWDAKEKKLFFESLREFGRNFESITGKVTTKSYEQVRHFYYRVLKKIDKLLAPQTVDKKNQFQVITALLCYWELTQNAAKEELTPELGASLRERISRTEMQHLPPEERILSPKAISPQPPISLHPISETFREQQTQLPTIENLTVQLVPRNTIIRSLLTQSDHNPNLQLSSKPTKTISSIISFLENKWRGVVAGPIRIYLSNAPGHPGWGKEDNVALQHIHQLSKYDKVMRLEYSWTLQPKTELEPPFLEEPHHIIQPKPMQKQHPKQVLQPPQLSQQREEETTPEFFPFQSTPSPSFLSSQPTGNHTPVIKSLLNENSMNLPFFDDQSSDGFAQRENSDELKCKSFYEQCQASQDGFDAGLEKESRTSNSTKPVSFGFRLFGRDRK